MNYPHWPVERPRVKQLLLRLKGLDEPTDRALTRASPLEAQRTQQLLRTLTGFTHPRMLQHPYGFPQTNNAGVSSEGQIQNGAPAVAKASNQQQSRLSRGPSHCYW
jgi:hypothetical protein